MDITTAIAIIIPSGTVVAAVAAVRQRFLDHEELDEERFADIKEMLKEIRLDVKEILKNGHKED